MNINELSDKQKSVILARLCGWTVDEVTQETMERLYGKRSDYMSRMVWRDILGVLYPFGLPNFYNTANMDTAWRVLNWATSNDSIHDELIDWDWHRWTSHQHIWTMPPTEAQRSWLDKILELAIEAGLVDLRPEERPQ